jgi:hypothetical protein
MFFAFDKLGRVNSEELIQMLYYSKVSAVFVYNHMPVCYLIK